MEIIKARENIKDYKGTARGSIRIKARSKQVIPVSILKIEIKEGYLPLIKTTEGLFIGEATASNQNGNCHVYVINNTKEDLELELPPQELIPFKYYNLPGDDSDENSTDEEFTAPRK